MKSLLTKVLSGFLVLLLVWGVSSWMLSASSKQQFETAIEAISAGKASSFLEVEVLNHEDTFFGSNTEIKLIPTSALFDESIEFQRFMLKKLNGPVFINQNGIQFGVARWEFSLIESDLTAPAQLLGEAIVGFSEVVDLRVERSALSIANWTFDEIVIDGVLDLTNASYEIKSDISGLSYQHKQFLLNIADASIESNSSDVNDSANNAGQFVLNTSQGELHLRGLKKKVPFTLQSNGSIWANNDTLSGDLQIKSAINESLKFNSALASDKTDDLALDMTLQFRELLTDGFWEIVNTQSEVFNLLQQAEWAMEDIETPEQQDFLRSLYLDVTRISLSQLHNPLKPMLIASRSKLAMKASLSKMDSDSVSQFTLGGLSSGKADNPALVMKGEMKVSRQMLNSQVLSLLDKWSKRRWVRQYETEFEADVVIRSQQLLLNNFLVSVDGLEAELSQAIADQ